MKTLRAMQFRALRESLKSYKDTHIHCKHIFETRRVIGKNINAIKLNKEYQLHPWKICTTKGHEFKLYSIDLKKALTSRPVYLITKDYRIIFVTQSNIFAPAADAWDVLTGVFYSHYEDGKPVYKSEEPTRRGRRSGDGFKEEPTVLVTREEMNYPKALEKIYWF